MIILFAMATATECTLYADHTADAAAYLAGAHTPAVDALRADTLASCERGWMPSEAIARCVTSQTDPEEILACEEDLRTDLEGWLWSTRTDARPPGMAQR